MSEMDEWLSTRPECVQALAREFQIGSPVCTKDGEMMWLIGYTERDQLILSPIHPSADYDKALASRVVVCASHYRASA